MERKLYAVCPRCGNRAAITKTVWDWDGEQDIALVKCTCGTSRMPCTESRIIKVDIPNPYMHEENNHFDLLVPPGWNDQMWNRIKNSLTKW